MFLCNKEETRFTVICIRLRTHALLSFFYTLLVFSRRQELGCSTPESSSGPEIFVLFCLKYVLICFVFIYKSNVNLLINLLITDNVSCTILKKKNSHFH